ncbi:hypothetical protein EC988_007063 [Linderina pennispora]|nr:hypothetical protein EC988_007063 [Linderina pennispora]
MTTTPTPSSEVPSESTVTYTTTPCTGCKPTTVMTVMTTAPAPSESVVSSESTITYTTTPCIDCEPTIITTAMTTAMTTAPAPSSEAVVPSESVITYTETPCTGCEPTVLTTLVTISSTLPTTALSVQSEHSAVSSAPALSDYSVHSETTVVVTPCDACEPTTITSMLVPQPSAISPTTTGPVPTEIRKCHIVRL